MSAIAKALIPATCRCGAPIPAGLCIVDRANMPICPACASPAIRELWQKCLAVEARPRRTVIDVEQMRNET